MEDHVPDVEWWDMVVMNGDKYSVDGKLSIREDAISNLVEHPTQMKPPCDYNESNFSICLFVFHNIQKKHFVWVLFQPNLVNRHFYQFF